jgi:hypothetical protein
MKQFEKIANKRPEHWRCVNKNDQNPCIFADQLFEETEQEKNKKKTSRWGLTMTISWRTWRSISSLINLGTTKAEIKVKMARIPRTHMDFLVHVPHAV